MSYRGSDKYDESTTQIYIQGSDCGKIIGRGGTKIREIERLSRCSRVKVMQDDEEDGQRCVELTGSARAIKEAENMIKETLDSANSYNGDRGDRGDRSFRNQSYGGYGESRGGDEKKEVMQVDSDCVGRIIGRKGSRIQELQDYTGCSIRINNDRGGYDKTDVDLVGSSRAIDAAKREILKITSYSSYSSY